MRRQIVLISWLVVILAGCTSPEPAETVAPTPTFVVTAAPAVDLTPRTDTLHLLDPPHLTGFLNARSEPIRVAIPPDSGNVEEVPMPTWTMPRPLLSELKITFHLWVEVTGVVTNYGTATYGSCFWLVAIHFEDQTGPMNNIATPCVPEGPVVPTGVRELVIDVPVINMEGREGARLAMTLVTFGAYAPGATVELLAGTLETDSTVAIEGLQLPIDTQTLLR